MIDPRENMAPGVCRIEAIYPNGSRGTGTSFFHVFNPNEDRTKGALCLVTNKHVIDGASTLRFFFCGKTDEGQRDGTKLIKAEFSAAQIYVFYHEDDLDLAIIPIIPILETLKSRGIEPFYNFGVSTTERMSEMLEEIGTVENIHLVGYPIGIYDPANNQPIIRGGITATPYKQNYRGKPEFLIDCACFPGSSGSPVYLANFGTILSRKTGTASFGYQFILLGILYAGPMYTAQGDIEIDPAPTSLGTRISAQVPINLGVCIKATELDKFEKHFITEDSGNFQTLEQLNRLS